MKVWHVPFHVIENEWTDEQFVAMLERLTERVEREKEEMDKPSRKPRSTRTGTSRRVESRSVGMAEFFATQGAQGAQVNGD